MMPEDVSTYCRTPFFVNSDGRTVRGFRVRRSGAADAADPELSPAAAVTGTRVVLPPAPASASLGAAVAALADDAAAAAARTLFRRITEVSHSPSTHHTPVAITALCTAVCCRKGSTMITTRSVSQNTVAKGGGNGTTANGAQLNIVTCRGPARRSEFRSKHRQL